MNEKSSEINDNKILGKIERLTKGLVYISESDSDVQAFSDGAVIGDDITSAILAIDKRTPVEGVPLDDFFARLTTEQDWYGPDDKKKAERFARLQRLIEENLRGIIVLKVGHVQKTIYIAGISPDNNLLGVKMDAVET